ncbi:response regulator [Pedomonas mirosovicensis]|uniref:response regulator n=1 Tax=Pedomonas mirosovicensis TaxID=2908641 RepID=UPI0021689CB5|nr:response regulator [Pedomonas mirosovicensis]MCH8685853.1 response regulator [Pedomonas mirosovicensis]
MDRLQGKTVLLVEDEPIVAMLVEDMLAGLGVGIIGPAARLEEAISMAQNENFDAAVLDVKLGGQNSVAVATVLQQRAIPYILATGFDSPTSPDYGRDVPVLNKPYLQDDLERALEQALSGINQLTK